MTCAFWWLLIFGAEQRLFERLVVNGQFGNFSRDFCR